jgi:hypothetical protein
MALVDNLQTAADFAAMKFAAGVADLLPRMVMAIILILLGWVVAVLLKRIALKILRGMKFEAWLKANKLEKALGTIVISDVVALVIYYYALTLFFQAAFDLVYLTSLAVFIGNLLAYVPSVIGAVLLVVVAAITGEYIKLLVLQLDQKSPITQLGGRLAKFLVLYIGVVMGLSTLGFQTEILNSIVISLSQAVFYGIALAFGLAFGFGGQDTAKQWISTARDKFLKA